MSSDSTIITNETSLSPTNNYSIFETQLSSASPITSRSSSIDSPTSSSNKNPFSTQTSSSSNNNNTKESTIKVPYPVLSDHRDPSSILILLQKETQTTSKKILDVIQQIEDCEKRLTTNFLSDKIKTSLKSQRIKRKQQLDALKKHERRVNLQIDYMTTKTEIKGLEDELIQMNEKKTSDEHKQIDILLKKLKQKLDQMKIYMRTRNDQMKKVHSEKSTSNETRKRSLSSMTNNSHGNNKHFRTTNTNHTKAPPPVVRLTSRSSNHQTKSHHLKQTPTVRFLNKTTNSTMNSASPTTPTSSSSTLSPPLTASTSTEETNKLSKSLQHGKLEDGEIDTEFDIDELFTEESYLETRQLNTSKTES